MSVAVPQAPARLSLRWSPSLLWIGPIAVVLGGSTKVSPTLVLLGLAAAGLFTWVFLRPEVAAYSLVFLTPLTVGIDRGSAIPVLRPNEALALVVSLALVARHLVRRRAGFVDRMPMDGVEKSLAVLVLFSSAIPLLWLALRGLPLTSDDVLYSLVTIKFAGVYVIVRNCIRTSKQVRTALYLSLAAAAIVAVVGILQALNLFGVRGLLAKVYVPNGYAQLVDDARGSSTLALPAAVADLVIYNLAICIALIFRGAKHPRLLWVAAGVFALGAVSAGEFSSVIGLIIGVVVVTITIRRPRLLLLSIPVGAVIGVLLWPVIQTRLQGFQSVSGLPVSWAGRLRNLESYFWPQLFSHDNYLLGVRPSARVPVVSQGTGFVWIESGYTWLLWSGGIPLLVAFCWFVKRTLVRSWRLARSSTGPESVAATGLVTALVVMTALMTFDPHLTYRGAADAMFFLIALSRPRTETAENQGMWTIMTDTGTFGLGTGEKVRHRPFLRAHARFLVVFTGVVLLSAAALSYTQPSSYTATARVLVEGRLLPNGDAPPPPDMGTEKEVAGSATVTDAAAKLLGLTTRAATRGLSISVPVDTKVLEISYTSSVPQEASRRASGFADAYVAFREPTGKSANRLATQDATVISEATTPRSPSGPNHVLHLIAALMLGLGAALTLAALRDRFDRHVRGPADVAELTALPVLATIPRPRLDGPPSLVVSQHPDSQVAESYRLLQDRLLDPFALTRTRSVLITCSSAADAPARDQVIANLAAVIGENGLSVAVVSDEGPGSAFEQVLGARHPRTEQHGALRGVPVVGTRAVGVDLIRDSADPARPVPLTEQLREEYDVVLVQGSPLEGYSRTRRQLRRADAALLVVDAELSGREAVRRAVEGPGEVRLDNLSAVLTLPCRPRDVGVPRSTRRHLVRTKVVAEAVLVEPTALVQSAS